jgi:alpha-ketoglutarate-dependent taurine dioxygenase
MSRGTAAGSVRRLHRHFGCELLQLQLLPDGGGGGVGPAAATTVATALAEHGLVLLRGQKQLGPRTLLNLVSAIPDVDPAQAALNPFSEADLSCLPDYPGVRALGYNLGTPDVNGATCAPAAADTGSVLAPEPEQNRIGKEWHTDGNGITALFAVHAPQRRQGSKATLFACGHRAWELLSADLQATAIGLRGRCGPRYTLEDSVAEVARRGGAMSANGLRLERHVDGARLSCQQRQLRASDAPNDRRWVRDGAVCRCWVPSVAPQCRSIA